MNQTDIDKAFEGRWRMKGYILENIDGKAAMEIARDFFEAGIMIGEGEEDRKLSKGDQLAIRANEFCKSLNTSENIAKYGMPMLKDFFDYWSEPNPSNTKMRFELQKTWDLNRRLARWARNNYNRYDRQQPTTDQQRISRLASILTD
jgi:hypothetical protein